MKKTILLLLTIVVFLAKPCTTRAEQVLCMVITNTDGTVNKFALQDAPVLTYEGNNLVVTCNDATLTTALGDIEQWSFEMADLDGIDEAETTPKAILSFGKANLTGLKSGSIISIYSIDGKAVSSLRADGEGNVNIDLSQLPGGIYIIRTPNQSYKISVKN